MSLRHIFARKDFDALAKAAKENHLHRALGPVSLTALGVGCIIGAGIFVTTGLAAAHYGGPAIIVSYVVAALACTLAALCYAEFAAMTPVAGSIYTYAYTTLGEIFAWIIGWDLILEYSMGTAAVASAWTDYLNVLLKSLFRGTQIIPRQFLADPFTHVEGLPGRPWFNLPSVLIMIVITTILVRGIKESARTNALLVMVKVGVVIFVICVGAGYVQWSNWTAVPVEERILPQEQVAMDLVKKTLAKPNGKENATDRIVMARKDLAERHQLDWAPAEVERLQKSERINRDEADAAVVAGLTRELTAEYRLEWVQGEIERLHAAGKLTADEAKSHLTAAEKKMRPRLAADVRHRAIVERLMPELRREGENKEMENWGLLGYVGIGSWLRPVDNATRTPFMPYGLSGLMLGASIVFFAYIGFDSISTHAEEARNPQRDVPIGIIFSLVLCTILYVAVVAVITGMVRYPDIDVHASIAVAFDQRAKETHSGLLQMSGALIAAGGLARMTSVLLVLFLSQARIFMAMARDGLLPKFFGRVHPRYRTPHVATMLTGAVVCLVAGFVPLGDLTKMVNIGTLLAFSMVCMAVMILRVQRPDVHRPFRCPLVWVVGPLGIVVNLLLMLFLPPMTWLRLLIWLMIGLAVYFGYSRHRSHLFKHLMHEIQEPRDERLDNEDVVEA